MILKAFVKKNALTLLSRNHGHPLWRAAYNSRDRLLALLREAVKLGHRSINIPAFRHARPQSVVWDEAENRLHAQKALMEYLLLGRIG